MCWVPLWPWSSWPQYCSMVALGIWFITMCLLQIKRSRFYKVCILFNNCEIIMSMYVCVCVCVVCLCARVCFSLKFIRSLHLPVVLGQFDWQDDAGDEEDHAPAQAEPECILGRREKNHGMQTYKKGIRLTEDHKHWPYWFTTCIFMC